MLVFEQIMEEAIRFQNETKQDGPLKVIYTSLYGLRSPKHTHHPTLSILQVCVSRVHLA